MWNTNSVVSRRAFYRFWLDVQLQHGKIHKIPVVSTRFAQLSKEVWRSKLRIFKIYSPQPRDLTAKRSHSQEISQLRDLTAKRHHSQEISRPKRSHSREISQPRDLTAKKSSQEISQPRDPTAKRCSQPSDLTAKWSHSQGISQPRDLTAKRNHSQEIRRNLREVALCNGCVKVAWSRGWILFFFAAGHRTSYWSGCIKAGMMICQQI